MTNWFTHLPWIGGFARERTGTRAHMIFDLAVACGAWIAAREK